MATTAHVALVGAIEDMARAQRETGAWLARTLECGRGGLALARVLQRGPRQVSELAHLLRVDVSVASRQVAALADAGLVAREVAQEDRRVRTVVLTDAGQALVARSAEAAITLASDIFAGWTDDEIDAAAAQFRKVAAAVTAHNSALSAHSSPAPLHPEREIA